MANDKISPSHGETHQEDGGRTEIPIIDTRFGEYKGAMKHTEHQLQAPESAQVLDASPSDRLHTSITMILWSSTPRRMLLKAIQAIIISDPIM